MFLDSLCCCCKTCCPDPSTLDDVQVQIDYKQPDLCQKIGPFAYLQANTQLFQHLISPQELIQLMSPPLNFAERKCSVYSLYGGTLILFAMIYYWSWTHPPGKDNKKMTGWYALVAFIILVGQVIIMEYNSCMFRRKLIEHVKNLNQYVLHNRGLHFYYNDYPCIPCLGKDVSSLGIRRYNPWDPNNKPDE